ncbi:MAG: LuxR C-terminal-related transcriptional regulator [Microbacterium sp.]|uniref:helix-turn-helix transcriptional regulator n=1 Tax=Microbacterium sp. TaxID=51671 RepID=UPI00271EF449|nr:LuxR C-terminal-related transcriptional regulator [Microbacterium sp.]MDO8384275.1 LuxR C-terminal-related transcriptional regulator [Microbacterium sp.]
MPTSIAAIADVVAAPLPEIARSLSEYLAPTIPHSALIILAEDDVSHPLKLHGDPALASRVALSEMVEARTLLSGPGVLRAAVEVGGAARNTVLARAETGPLLVLVDPVPAASATDPDADVRADAELLQLWRIVAVRIRQPARDASPSYLLESRAAAGVRAEVVAELSDTHSRTLEALLAVLRSPSTDDHAARQAAVGVAAHAMVQLRTSTDLVRTFTEEPVTSAFERLRDDLVPLVRYRDVDVQFVEPPVDGRALPSEIAHGARAIVRRAILASVEQPGTSRVRVKWDCDGRNLLISVRDDGPGDASLGHDALDELRQRVSAVNGEMTLAATEGWGSELSVVMPLDPPHTHGDDPLIARLGPREVEILELMTQGLRNRGIAARLGISENTVKFHVSKVFRKLGVTSRSEATALIAAGRAHR